MLHNEAILIRIIIVLKNMGHYIKCHNKGIIPITLLLIYVHTEKDE